MKQNDRFWWMLGGSLLLIGGIAFLFFRGPGPNDPDGPAMLSESDQVSPSKAEKQRVSGQPETARVTVSSDSKLDSELRPSDIAASSGTVGSALEEAAPGSEDPLTRRVERTSRPLSRTPNPSNEDVLAALASSPFEADRVRAAMLLGRRAGQSGLATVAVPVLLAALETDDTPQVWLAAAQALGSYGDDAVMAVPSLLTWFDHLTMRDVAIDALASIGTGASEALPAISVVASDSQEPFISRRKAIEALVRIGGPDDPYLAEVLQTAAKEPEPRLAIAAEQAAKVWLIPETDPGVPPVGGGG